MLTPSHMSPPAVLLFSAPLLHIVGAQEADASVPLSKNTAMYILIAIAAAYFALTALCLLLVVCVCYCNHFFKKKSGATHEKTENIPLTPMKEEDELKDVDLRQFGYSPLPKTVTGPSKKHRDKSQVPPIDHLGVPFPGAPSPVHKLPSARKGKRHRDDGQTQVYSNKLRRQDFGGTSPTSIRGVINPGYLEESTPTVSLMKSELLEISHKWYNMGRILDIPETTLNNILQLNKTDDELCLMNMCEQWLRTESNPSWSTIVAVLESRLIDEPVLAHTIKEKYSCSDPFANYSPVLKPKKSASDLDLDEMVAESFSRI